MKKSITITPRKMTSILLELEYIVVSLDQIGSANLSEAVVKEDLHQFIVGGNVFKRLATIRKDMFSAVDKAASRAEVRSLEAKLERVKPWHPG